MSVLPQEIIRRKRDGEALSEEEIGAFVAGLVSGAVTHAQVAAFAMAVFFRGMSMAERVAFTRAMTHSGTVLDWSGLGLPGPVLDKHSTGGVGDNVSLMLAPAVAACGGFVPMISGRGLGHTGGTLDKLDSIPGYATQPDSDLFRRVVREAGAAIIGQTADLAPADKTVYAVRDVTATVESVPLITASILSKKLAAGLQALVMDVKTGSGAFMPTLEGSRELAASIAGVATGAGLPTTALITAMDQPLASAAGNAVEVRNAIDFLTGARRDPRLLEVTLALGAEMLVLGKLARTPEDGRTAMLGAYESGAAAERFARMVAALGGPADLLDRPDSHLQAAPVVRPVPAPAGGRIGAIDTRAVGLAVVALGGGRTRPQDPVDHAVGFTELAALGDTVDAQRPLALVHARSEAAADAATAALQAACSIGEAEALPPVLQRIEA
ncbi:thymidine phosphorylase [Labrys wisconsinensis]|uniref:Thymidine phosphorylase n=1 Tax=Labrys wisconsinensis TaxID=425677 RepID=A0ABU0JDR0_9HYPH|nr:thymidine phosphorylase [Labrys wisconsinensis]MDQ0472421.1 thymidine phosphorylase [Labrys wisconsinensis]